MTNIVIYVAIANFFAPQIVQALMMQKLCLLNISRKSRASLRPCPASLWNRTEMVWADTSNTECFTELDTNNLTKIQDISVKPFLF